MHNKIFISVDFEPKNFDPKLDENQKNWAKFFGSKSAEMKILLCKVDMRNKLYEIKIFELCCKKMELLKQIHLFIKGFVIFLNGATVRFRILLRLDYETFSIRFKPHQGVYGSTMRQE